MKNQVKYMLPVQSEEIRLIRDALEQYSQNNEDDDLKECMIPTLQKVKLLNALAVAERRYSDLTNRFREMTGCEPDDL